MDTADWCDYTRTIPAGQYQVWAALSYGDTGADECSGWLHQISGDVTTSTQTATELGRFDAPGTAGWGRNSLVPMKTTPDHNTPTVSTNDAAIITLPVNYAFMVAKVLLGEPMLADLSVKIRLENCLLIGPSDLYFPNLPGAFSY